LSGWYEKVKQIESRHDGFKHSRLLKWYSSELPSAYLLLQWTGAPISIGGYATVASSAGLTTGRESDAPPCYEGYRAFGAR